MLHNTDTIGQLGLRQNLCKVNSSIIAQLCLAGAFLIYFGSGVCDAKLSSHETANLCDGAAVIASQAQGVPLDVLKAITRTETGRAGKSGLQPWPWTVNMEGAGRWFATEDEARAYVFSHFKQGARSFDVGCFQINYRWHGAAFRSIDDMFDPTLNAEYAATFLLKLYTEFGDWSVAAGAYHSRTPATAKAYSARFKTIRSRISDDQPLTKPSHHVTSRPPARRGLELVNSSAHPFVGQGSPALGSLVPMAGSTAVSRAFVVME